MTRPTASGRPSASASPDSKPSLRFYHSDDLRARTLQVLAALESPDAPTDQRESLAALVVELTESGLDYYFVKPVREAKVGFMAEQSTKLGIASILKVMGPVTRRIISGMDSTQLRVVTTHLRHLM
jgi:hypothetical protein